ncbi:hypothetical protein [Pseudolysinimonas kribbensis]
MLRPLDRAARSTPVMISRPVMLAIAGMTSSIRRTDDAALTRRL